MKIQLSIQEVQNVERLVGDFVVILQEVERVVPEVEPSLGPIMLLWCFVLKNKMFYVMLLWDIVLRTVFQGQLSKIIYKRNFPKNDLWKPVCENMFMKKQIYGKGLQKTVLRNDIFQKIVYKRNFFFIALTFYEIKPARFD